MLGPVTMGIAGMVNRHNCCGPLLLLLHLCIYACWSKCSLVNLDICYCVQWSLWACQACWACRASWAWWQPGSLFLAEAASAMCPQWAGRPAREPRRPGGAQQLLQSFQSCESRLPRQGQVCAEAAAPGLFGGGDMLGGGHQIPPKPTLKGMLLILGTFG